jgi:hypothetical protein
MLVCYLCCVKISALSLLSNSFIYIRKTHFSLGSESVKLYFIFFFLWVVITMQLSALSGELSINYQQSLYNGYGANFWQTSALARYFNSFILPSHENNYLGSQSATMAQPTFNVGLEGALLIPMTTTKNAVWHFVGSYAVKYDQSHYDLPYLNNVNDIDGGGSIIFPDAPKAQVMDIHRYSYHAVVNQVNAGIRMTHRKHPVYGQFTLGGLLYTPFNAIYQRGDIGVNEMPAGRWSVSGHNNERIKLYNLQSGIESDYDFNLSGSSEVLLVLEGRIGYKFAYTGLQLATNGRITTLGLHLGITLAPWGGTQHD